MLKNNRLFWGGKRLDRQVYVDDTDTTVSSPGSSSVTVSYDFTPLTSYNARSREVFFLVAYVYPVAGSHSITSLKPMGGGTASGTWTPFPGNTTQEATQVVASSGMNLSGTYRLKFELWRANARLGMTGDPAADTISATLTFSDTPNRVRMSVISVLNFTGMVDSDTTYEASGSIDDNATITIDTRGGGIAIAMAGINNLHSFAAEGLDNEIIESIDLATETFSMQHSYQTTDGNSLNISADSGVNSNRHLVLGASIA